MFRRRARRVTFRIRKAMFLLLRQVASNMDCSLASLCQFLIVAGSIFYFVKFENAQERRLLASAARGNRLADTVDEASPLKRVLVSLSRTDSMMVSGPLRNRPHVEGSELMKVRLPSTFVRRIDLYAKLTKASRSAILTRFFERGLLLYMRSQRALMRAIVESMKTNAHDH